MRGASKIEIDIERTIWDELKTSPPLVQQKYEMDCRFIHYTKGVTRSQDRLEHLRELNKQWRNRR